MSRFDLVEIARRLENIIRNGTIAEVDYQSARVRVKYDEDESGNDILTDWLPWLTTRAGNDRTWWAPELGEQVLILSPSGNLALGTVLPAINQTAHPAPESDPNKHRTVYEDGSFVEYDRNAHKLTVTVNGGDAVLNTTGNLDAAVGGDALVNAGGNAEVDAQGHAKVTANKIDLDGAGGGGVKGAVQGDCTCAFTGAPHPQVSATVKASK